jgi:hypothetical protein
MHLAQPKFFVNRRPARAGTSLLAYLIGILRVAGFISKCRPFDPVGQKVVLVWRITAGDLNYDWASRLLVGRGDGY